MSGAGDIRCTKSDAISGGAPKYGAMLTRDPSSTGRDDGTAAAIRDPLNGVTAFLAAAAAADRNRCATGPHGARSSTRDPRAKSGAEAALRQPMARAADFRKSGCGT
jgi:hypothetical protein